jgi:hypothetical protein
MNQSGVFSFFIIFAFASISLLLLFFVFLPALQTMMVKTTAATSKFDALSIAAANDITNSSIKAEVLSSINTQDESLPAQIETLSVFIKYAAVLIIVIVLLVLFVRARMAVESEKRMSGGLY